jgi:hypothetical protein
MSDSKILVSEVVSCDLHLLHLLSDDLGFVSHHREEEVDFIKIVNGLHISRNFNLS